MTVAPDPNRKLRSVHAHAPRFVSLRTMMALVLREMAATYGRSPGGYVWAVLEPAIGIGLLVLLFSLGFRSPPLGTNFAIFYATGLLPFFMFTVVTSKVQNALNYSSQLLSYPRVTYFDALFARWALTVLTQGVVSYILLVAIVNIWETRTVLHFWVVFNAFAMAAALALGIGFLNCLLILRAPIWGSVWSVISRPLLLVSGVLFLHDRVPEPYRSWMEWNPLVHVTGESRKGFYYSYDAKYVDYAYVYGVSGACLLIALLFLSSYNRDLLER